MEVIEGLMTQSAQLREARYLSDQGYDRQIRENVAFLRHVISTRSLGAFSSDESVLDPILAVRLIRDAMLRLDPSCAVFTSTHLLFVRLCLRARTHTHALPVLDKYVCHFPTSTPHLASKSSVVPCATLDSSLSFITGTSGISSKLTYKDYLQYFLCGGMVYMALKQWHKAAHFLGIVISMPTAGPISMIMLEAYKKWILVSLLDKGKAHRALAFLNAKMIRCQLSSPSNLISPHVVKLYHSLAKPYVNLAHSFQRDDLKHLEAEVDAARDIWCTDNNMGLVSQVLGAYSKHTVLGIKQTFAALTVKELTNQVSSVRMSDEATESFIASLIMSGAVKATLVQHSSRGSSTMLRFSEAHSLTQLSDERRTQICLAREKQSLGTLMGHLDEISHHVELSDEFVDSLQKGQIWSTTSDVNPGISEDAALEIDEDLMGEVS
ncbi:COP9 signalosome complex subunit 3 [Penicillium rolfsii]|nr:COP9 signalosome complex subunit 3 [Penicillium rolfsii]